MARNAKTAVSLLLLLAGLALSTPAGAIPTYPLRMDQHLTLGYRPDCITCHTSAAGGIGTVTQPFGVSAVGFGLVSFDDQSLFDALDALENAGTDSDMDGTDDITELRNMTNPNAEDPEIVEAPEYGCFGRVTGRPPALGGLVLLGLLLAGVLIRRRRR